MNEPTDQDYAWAQQEEEPDYSQVMYESSSKHFLKKIIGKKLTKIGVSEDGVYLIMLFDDLTGQLVGTEGDCCSHSYFHEVLGAKGAMEVGTVRGIRMLDAGPSFEDPKREHVQSYGWAIDTDSGSIRVIYRNDSNGYYGGWAFETNPDRVPLNTTFNFIFSNDWSG